MLFHGSVYLQLTVPFTCTDMRFILFINNLSTLLLIIYVDILYKSLLLMKCVIFFFFFCPNVPFFSHVMFLMIGVSHCDKFTDGRQEKRRM